MNKPENSNYVAVVTPLRAIVHLDNCDNVVSTPLFGLAAIVGKNSAVGDLGIFIPCESQLSEEFCRENNLYRHAELNKDPTQKGYIEDNRRVRAIKFRGNPSNCLFMPLSSLAYTGIDLDTLLIGDEFDTINGHEICKKYVAKRNASREMAVQPKKKSRVDEKHMPQHFDTLNYFKFMDTIAPEETVIITQKLHGTSIRIGHTLVKRPLGIRSKIAKMLGVQVLETDHDYVYGSRKVIKDANNPEQMHYYDADIWTEEGKKLLGILPKNYLVYGELVGYTADGKEIQKDYTYNLPVGQCEMYVYRIAIVNEDGHVTDLMWDSVKKVCSDLGIKHVPEIARMKKEDLDIAQYVDARYFDNPLGGHKNCLYLGNNDLVDEGVCIRAENPVRIYKAKSPKFLEHETSMLDVGAEDLESTQNEI